MTACLAETENPKIIKPIVDKFPNFNIDKKLSYFPIKLVWFLCFNGISIFMGYLMPTPSFQKNISGTTEPIARGIREFIPF